MVLEETLVFNSSEDADEFIRYLRKKRIKAHKKSTAEFHDVQKVRGPIDNVITYLNTLAGDEETDDDIFCRGSPLERLIASLIQRREALLKLLSSHEVGDLVFSKDEILEHSKTAAEHMMQMMLPIFSEAISGLGHDLPPGRKEREITGEDAEEARETLAIFDLLEDNKMIEKEGEHYRLTRKLPPDECMAMVSLMGLADIDPGDLPRHGLSSRVSLVGEVQYTVFIDPGIHVWLSIDEIEEGLEGLETDAGSEEHLYRSLERKQLAIRAILELVEQSGRISLDTLHERLLENIIDVEESTETVSLVLSREFLSLMVHDLRKEGFLTGSQENIRIGKA
jgi:hypothetical protein